MGSTTLEYAAHVLDYISPLILSNGRFRHKGITKTNLSRNADYHTHKAISYTVGFVSRKRPFSTEAQIGLSYAVEKGLFRLDFFRLSFPTGGSSRKSNFFDWIRYFFDWIRQSKNSVEKSSHVFFNPSHPSSHHQTHPHAHTPTHHTHTPTPGTTQHSINNNIEGADAGMAITVVASRRKSAWRIPSSARQQRVSHDGSSARYRSHFANNGYACCSFDGSRLSETPRA